MHKNHKSAVVTGSLWPEGPQIGASSNRFTPDRLLTKAVMDMATSGPVFADDLPSRNRLKQNQWGWGRLQLTGPEVGAGSYTDIAFYFDSLIQLCNNAEQILDDFCAKAKIN